MKNFIISINNGYDCDDYYIVAQSLDEAINTVCYEAGCTKSDIYSATTI